MFIEVLCCLLCICILVSIMGIFAPLIEIGLRYTMSEEEVDHNYTLSLYCTVIAVILSMTLAILTIHQSNSNSSIMPSKYKTGQHQ